VATLELTKYQASGNDFLVVDELARSVGDLDVPALCDRWTGIGADGLIRVGRGTIAPYAFALTNADGSPAEMSGNGMRCVAAWLRDRELVAHGDAIDVETPAGTRHVWLTLEGATVQMGGPNFTKAAIPMRGPAWETFQEQPLDIGDGRTLAATAVSMGNPHLVLFTEADPERYHLEHIGPALEQHELFPERTNVEFARVTSESSIEVRVWERGVGETLSCGTGACAVAVAAHEAGRTGAEVAVRFRGGTLRVERRTDGEVLLGGPVHHVFDAVVDLDELEA
jgi:diaminopimelate epimerase